MHHFKTQAKKIVEKTVCYLLKKNQQLIKLKKIVNVPKKKTTHVPTNSFKILKLTLITELKFDFNLIRMMILNLNIVAEEIIICVKK